MSKRRPAFQFASYQPMFGVAGACAYVAGFGIPLRWDIPLLLLAAASLTTSTVNQKQTPSGSQSALLTLVLVFLLATALSIAFSTDASRSARLSLAFLPGTLLFLVVSRHFATIRDTRLFYLTWSVVALGVGCAILGRALVGDWRTLHNRIADVGSPILVEANDVTVLAILAPLSVVLLHAKSSRAVWILCALSLMATICAICVLQSRTAILTLMVSVGSVIWLLRRPGAGAWKRLAFLVLAIVLIDALLGFPLRAKFQHVREPRISLWIAAWLMFLDAPLLGHGPHTFLLLHRSYLSTLSLPAWFPIEPRTSPWAHNVYLEVLAEQGIVGLTTFAFLLGAAVWLAWRLYRHPSSEVHGLGAGALAALAGFCFAGIFELSFLRLWVVIVFFALLGVVSQLSTVSTTKGL